MTLYFEPDRLENPFPPLCPYARGQKLRAVYPQIAHEGIVYSVSWNASKWVVKVAHNSKATGVCLVDLKEFENGSQVSAQIIDSPESPDHEAWIIGRAQWAIENHAPYLLFYQNCEHFASWCYTGVAESHSLKSLWELLGTAVLVIGSAVVVKGIADSARRS